MKVCTKCHKTKPTCQFGKMKKGRNGLNPVCIECVRGVLADWASKNPEKIRNSQIKYKSSGKGQEAALRQHLQKKYGIGVMQYVAMLIEQNGGCKICKSLIPFSRRNRFFVDHDHNTGAIRGLLCLKCNSLLGMANDDVDILFAAANYLTKHAEKSRV